MIFQTLFIASKQTTLKVLMMKFTAASAVIILALMPTALCLGVTVPSVPLMNAAKPGVKMPATGIGTGSYVHSPASAPGESWDDMVAEKAIGQWLSVGGRRIDGAGDYGDQVGVGKAIKASNISREDIFMVSKISPNGYNETLSQVKDLLSDLQMDYVDLLLIHWPQPNPPTTDPACQNTSSNPHETWRECRQSVWKALVETYNSGKAKAIGVSNFEKNHVEDILMMNSEIPSVNQVEFNPYWHEEDLLAYCKEKKIVFNGYAPLGAPDWAPHSHGWSHSILDEPVIKDIAKTHNRTAAEVILSWQWSMGVLVNPRTLNTDHMKEDLGFFDLKLSDGEIKQILSIKPPSNPKVCGDPHHIK